MLSSLILLGKRNYVRSRRRNVLRESDAPKSKSRPSNFVFVSTNTYESPIRSTWTGASRLATNKEEMKKVAITRQEYQEHGSGWAWRKFAGAL